MKALYVDLKGGLGFNISFARVAKTLIKKGLKINVITPYWDVFLSANINFYKPNEYRDFIFDAKNENAEIIEKIAAKMYRVHFGYMSMNSVMKVMKDMGLEQKNQKFDMECSIDTSVRLSLVDSFLERMKDVDGCYVDEI
jgi:hypothetical protein